MSVNLKKSGNAGSSPPETPGREDLKFWHRELAGALTAEREGIALITALRETIAAGQRAKTSAIAGLHAAGGQALANGGDLTAKIANGALAAEALPSAEEKLATAQSEVTRLRAAVTEAAKRELTAEADAVLAEYDKHVVTLCEIYDELIGVKQALLGEHGHAALEIPLFRMVPHAETSTHRHGPTDGTGETRRTTLAAQADWTKALDRLIESPSADLTDLIGTA
ncbi:hypothetical protein [Bradyrhizobium genosp. P]|uniref:hypothetical protein n=1 Tax=Bradyrhizobium genosp. P TaxID=83641 RepID=UPI003CF08245